MHVIKKKGVLESGGGAIIDKVPNEFSDDVCIVYKNETAWREDKENADKDVIKFLLDPLLDCVLKQNFDLDLRIK